MLWNVNECWQAFFSPTPRLPGSLAFFLPGSATHLLSSLKINFKQPLPEIKMYKLRQNDKFQRQTAWNASYKNINLMVGDPPNPPWLVHAPKLHLELTARTSVSLRSLRQPMENNADLQRRIFHRLPCYVRWTFISSALIDRKRASNRQCTGGASSIVNIAIQPLNLWSYQCQRE